MGLEPPSVFLRVGRSRGPLALRRTPKYLRFVMRGVNWDSLDALDQLNDEPAEHERVIVAVKVEESMVHIGGTTKGGRRTGWWVPTVTYQPVPNPPDADVVRETAKWRAWCLRRHAQRGSR